MAQEKAEHHSKFKNIFQRFKAKEAEPEAPAVVDPPPEEPKKELSDQIPVTEGALLDIWRRWAGETPPPVLSLSGTDGAGKLPLDAETLDRERQKLEKLLQQDAKTRLRTLEASDAEGADSLEAECLVYLSNDRMVAWAVLFPPSDPAAELQVTVIGQAMQKLGITAGVDSTAIMHLLQKKAYFQLCPIAVGTPVQEGENGRIIEHYPRQLTQEVKVDEDGVADYRALNYVQQVDQGDVICDIVPPKEGVAGLRVDGKVVTPKQVHAAKVPSGKNTVLSPDGLQLMAGQEGHLEFANNMFHVRPVLDVAGDVDYSTGNIDFRGDVHIRGDVRDNFCVRATGTVTIDGLVEAALVETGGDLVIACGVQGDNKAVLKSRGNIRVKYLESCVAYAGACIYADCIMSSQVFSDDTIEVNKGRGAIIGGTLTAAKMVKARLIGSQAGRRTEIMLGVMSYAKDDLENVKEDLKAVREELHGLNKILSGEEERQGMEGGNAALAKLQMRKSALVIKEMQLKKQKEKLESTEPDLARCRLECSIMYPITQLMIGPACLYVDTIRQHCKLGYDPHLGEIKMI